MATLKELMAKQSPESQQRIAAKAAEIRQSVALNLLRCNIIYNYATIFNTDTKSLWFS